MSGVLNWLWARVWRRYLDGYQVVKIYNWRLALVADRYGNRRTIQPMPKWVFWDRV